MVQKNNKNTLLILILFTFSFLSILWMLTVSNSFTFDDFTTLCNARFKTFNELFSFLPSKSYNDRPIGLMFIKVLNILFGLNYQSYHIVFGIVHFINIILVYKISKLVFDGVDEKLKIYFSVIAAAVFGIYPASLMTVSWISAVYDILCCLFTLLSLYFYLKSRINLDYCNFYALISIICFYFSIRTKEMSLTLPLIILVYELWKSLDEKKRIKLRWYLFFQLFMMVFFVLRLYLSGVKNVTPDNPYYQSFNIFSLFKNAIRYMFLYFDWGNSGFTFTDFSYGALFGVGVFGIIVIFSLYKAIKRRDFSILLSIISIGISITVVLTMVNMQHRLYLYIPSVFIGLTVAIVLYKVMSYFQFKYLWEFIIIFILCLYLVNYTPGMVGYKVNWLNYCSQDANSLKQIEKLQAPVDDTNVYVKGALEGYNIFFYGPGNSLKLMFDNQSINTILVDEFPDNPEQPYIFLDNSNNSITEVKRDMTPKALVINSIYPSQIDSETTYNKDGSLNIGVVCNIASENLKILINGEEMNTSIGKDFISTVIPKQLLKVKKIEVMVKDSKTNSISNKMIIDNN
ncbi:hypothetical protein [Anaeromicropila herbilytica]|uniref:Glycosyltransferase RgtA/B/C/D-like domain-containing protein n=1 Tax=Anaeromicropila herbilytica TaxID=2785025 RepID=A0A7R7ENQ3_9FIRM|nr:hypothetical protein [Anaeromicropila herbilytica]BCN32214.1 hypothetical protein bsdtb5_35090 [Anaeromicropila herbilytica]